MKTIFALWFALCLSASAALPAPAWLASATKAAGGSPPALSSPTNVAGACAFYDASLETPITDSAQIPLITDWIGGFGKLSATNVAESSCLLYRTAANGVNGIPAFEGNGSSTGAATATTVNIVVSNITVYLVLQTDTVNTDQGMAAFTDTDTYWFDVGGGCWTLTHDTGNHVYSAANKVTDYSEVNGTTAMSTSWHVVFMSFNRMLASGQNLWAYLGTNSVGALTHGPDNAVGSLGTHRFMLGSDSGHSWDGKIAQCCVYTNILTAQNRMDLTQYAIARFNIAGN